MGSNSTSIDYLKNLQIGTKFKCKIGPIDEWRMYEKNNVKFVCPNDDSKNMANRNWELDEFCSVFNDKQIEVIESIVENKREYKVGDIIENNELMSGGIDVIKTGSIIQSTKTGFEYEVIEFNRIRAYRSTISDIPIKELYGTFKIIHIPEDIVEKIVDQNIIKEYKVEDIILFDEIKNLPINSIIKSIYTGCYYLTIPRGIIRINTPNIFKFNDPNMWAGDEFRIITLGYK